MLTLGTISKRLSGCFHAHPSPPMTGLRTCKDEGFQGVSWGQDPRAWAFSLSRFRGRGSLQMQLGFKCVGTASAVVTSTQTLRGNLGSLAIHYRIGLWRKSLMVVSVKSQQRLQKNSHKHIDTEAQRHAGRQQNTEMY